MPIYEFKCTDCGRLFEALVWSSDEKTLMECPTCKSSNLERLLSSFSRCAAGASESTSCKPAGSKFG